MFSAIYNSLLTVVYPQACMNCQKSVENLSDGIACAFCWKKTRIFTGRETLCAKCGCFLHKNLTESATFCHRCEEHFYDGALAVGKYEHALAASILYLKREPFIAERLQTNIFTRFKSSRFLDSTRIIPVPLSRKRRMERGFNQSAIIAAQIAAHFNLPVDEESLVRSVDTPMHRAAMDTKAREKSVKNVFHVEHPNSVKDAVILLVDDVFTSGATASACAETLKEHGARKVYVFTIARAL